MAPALPKFQEYGLIDGLILSNNAMDAANDIDIAVSGDWEMIGLRADLTDIIYNIEPLEIPFEEDLSFS